jgi:hypothetical protein
VSLGQQSWTDTGWGLVHSAGRTFISDSRFTCSIWKASCSFTRATSSWLCCVTVSCLAVSAFYTSRDRLMLWPWPVPLSTGQVVPQALTFLSSSACVLMSSLCFSFNLL